MRLTWDFLFIFTTSDSMPLVAGGDFGGVSNLWSRKLTPSSASTKGLRRS